MDSQWASRHLALGDIPNRSVFASVFTLKSHNVYLEEE